MLKTLDEVLVLFEEKADSVGSYFKCAKSGHPEEEIQELEDSLGLKIAANYGSLQNLVGTGEKAGRRQAPSH